jgi:transcriptional regulator with XRE-family HTH domain
MAGSFDAMVRRTTSKEVIARGRRRGRRMLVDMMLGDLRKMSGMSQRDLAAALGIKQPSLSKLENQSDMQIRTLRRIIEALGGELQIVAKFPRRKVQVLPFNEKKKRRRAA